MIEESFSVHRFLRSKVWREMDAPPYLSGDEVGRLMAVSEIVSEQQRFNYQDNVVSFEINLPPHSVAAIECELGGS